MQLQVQQTSIKTKRTNHDTLEINPPQTINETNEIKKQKTTKQWFKKKNENHKQSIKWINSIKHETRVEKS